MERVLLLIFLLCIGGCSVSGMVGLVGLEAGRQDVLIVAGGFVVIFAGVGTGCLIGASCEDDGGSW